jgi:RimJ/RimL family protein N-acetyltransferase
MGENDYITGLHRLASRSVFDDIERDSIYVFKDRIKQAVDVDTLGWVCWMKEPVVRVGIVYFSNVILGVNAIFHPILDVGGYRNYVKSNGSIRIRVMDEASLVAIRYVFSNLKLQRITGAYFVYNKLMINLCKRLGFREEGIIRHGTKVDGKPVDMIIMGLLREEVK